ncbi:agmatine deiminase family protein [Yinghuangia soli]|uniref:Agmatine deiminase family protein n=1 Tax=Yinghuangia soli TaxID=2908204 RepID=A0AA41PYE6_9ACTN|nr:agmatine deiminase family protein [Yinghuangia soli]MCF2527466.1 agmatine deiminase family protein [Yinghuangia soli]
MFASSLSRRAVLRGLLGAGAVALGATACTSADASGGGSESPAGTPGTAAPQGGTAPRKFAAEWERHERTVMSWPASTGIWGADLTAVRADIARIARAIAEFEPVVLLARPRPEDAAQRASGAAVEVVALDVDDLWARDTVAVFVEEAGQVVGVDFNFNGWGKKQTHAADAKVAAAVTARYGLRRDQAQLVAEGGSFETDGAGTLLLTESSLINDNRNPGKSKADIEAELKRALGVTAIVWCEGVRGQDITDAHIDSLVRFTEPGVVLLDTPFPGTPADSWSRSADQARKVLGSAVDAHGKKFEVVDLPQPDPDAITGQSDDFLSTYANFYIANDGVFMPEFGDRRADDRARGILAEHFPGREIVPVRIDAVASGGGGIHCATHDVPAAPGPGAK